MQAQFSDRFCSSGGVQELTIQPASRQQMHIWHRRLLVENMNVSKIYCNKSTLFMHEVYYLSDQGIPGRVLSHLRFNSSDIASRSTAGREGLKTERTSAPANSCFGVGGAASSLRILKRSCMGESWPGCSD